MNSFSRILNGLSTSFVAIFFAQVLHETVHLASAVLVGAPVREFNLFAVNISLFNDTQNAWRDILIESSASIMNLIIGVISLILFHLVKTKSLLKRQFLLQLTALNFLMGFGYLLFDGLFYAPQVPGDWKSVISILGGSIILRIVLIAIGAAGMLFTFFWLARNVLVFTYDRSDLMARKQAVKSILLIPYIALSLLYIFLSIWHPMGWQQGMLIVFLQFVFGFSGLLWGYFLAVYWLNPKKGQVLADRSIEKVSVSWLIVAILLLVFQIVVLLPSVMIASA